MADYNMLSQVIHDDRLTPWRFRVKIIRAASFYSPISFHGPNWRYILADEEDTKMELTIYVGTTRADKLTHLETVEGRWVEIFGVCVVLDLASFKAANSIFRLLPTYYTKVNIINPLNNRHYMEFRNIHDIPHIRNTNFPIEEGIDMIAVASTDNIYASLAHSIFAIFRGDYEVGMAYMWNVFRKVTRFAEAVRVAEVVFNEIQIMGTPRSSQYRWISSFSFTPVCVSGCDDLLGICSECFAIKYSIRVMELFPPD